VTAKTQYTNIGTVTGIRIYSRDVVIVRDGDAPAGDGHIRGEIKNWSLRSRQRLAFVAANTDANFRTMITLTYPQIYSNDGQRIKRDLDTFLKWLRRETAGCSYLWFLEFQKRGAPHYHILIDWPMPRTRQGEREVRFRVAATWYRIVGSGDAKHLAAGTRTERVRKDDGAKRYAVKYALKMEQKAVPPAYRNVGRLWGASRDVMPVARAEFQVTEDDIRGQIENWPYKPDADRTLYRVLYGCASLFVDGQAGLCKGT